MWEADYQRLVELEGRELELLQGVGLRAAEV